MCFIFVFKQILLTLFLFPLYWQRLVILVLIVMSIVISPLGYVFCGCRGRDFRITFNIWVLLLVGHSVCNFFLSVIFYCFFYLNVAISVCCINISCNVLLFEVPMVVNGIEEFFALWASVSSRSFGGSWI